eukprot:4563034-Heterocapsa_arctica.AAC.1
MLARSSGRRWWPTAGAEWSYLGQTRSFNAAYHVCRLLSGGVATSVACRPNAERKNFPRLCTALRNGVPCGAKSPRWAWRTPSVVQSGIA